MGNCGSSDSDYEVTVVWGVMLCSHHPAMIIGAKL
jgi:hypothetical protein